MSRDDRIKADDLSREWGVPGSERSRLPSRAQARPCWYAKYRFTDGRQVQKKLGPAWTGRGRPAAGYFTKRLAEDWLRETLADARRGTLAGGVRTGATFADAAAEWLRYVEHDRDVKPSTLTDYRSVVARLLPVFGSLAVEEITARHVEEIKASPEAVDQGEAVEPER